MSELQSWEKSYTASTERFEAELKAVCFIGFETALSFQGAADQYIAALVEENRLLTAERDHFRAKADGTWSLAVNAHKSREQLANYHMNAGQEDR